MLVKGRAPVEEKSGLSDTHHVMDREGTLWTASMSLVNLRACPAETFDV